MDEGTLNPWQWRHGYQIERRAYAVGVRDRDGQAVAVFPRELRDEDVRAVMDDLAAAYERGVQAGITLAQRKLRIALGIEEGSW